MPDERPKAGQEPAHGRRDFLATAGNLAAGACCLGLAACAVRLAVPDFLNGPPVRFPVGRAAYFKMRTMTWLREHDLFVLHDDMGFGAFSARCTHLGCPVQRTADGFSCPCHGARFDMAGRVLSGPARRALPWYRLWIEPDGRLWVAVDEPVRPGARPRVELEIRPASGGGP